MAKPAKNFEAVVATANALKSGAVVYRTKDGSWVRELAQAAIARSKEEADQLMAAAERDVVATLVIDLALIEVTHSTTGHVQARTLRERIRAEGPSVAFPTGPKTGTAA